MSTSFKPERRTHREPIGPVTEALVKAGAQWFRGDELPDGYRAEIDTTPLLPGPLGTVISPSVPVDPTNDMAPSVANGTPQEPTPGSPERRTRGTTNRNARGTSEDRRRRRVWLVTTWRADVDVAPLSFGGTVTPVPLGTGWPACRCYRCGVLLTEETVSADRIIPGCRGGTYRRDNIRPACPRCQSVVGGGTRSK